MDGLEVANVPLGVADEPLGFADVLPALGEDELDEGEAAARLVCGVGLEPEPEPDVWLGAWATAAWAVSAVAASKRNLFIVLYPISPHRHRVESRHCHRRRRRPRSSTTGAQSVGSTRSIDTLVGVGAHFLHRLVFHVPTLLLRVHMH